LDAGTFIFGRRLLNDMMDWCAAERGNRMLKLLQTLR